MNIQTVVQAIRQIQASDKHWIPEEFRGPTYFGMWDQWIFETQESSDVCTKCEEYSGQTLYGSELRSLFSYCFVDDWNTIYPAVHPNCRCRLVRTKFIEEEKYA